MVAISNEIDIDSQQVLHDIGYEAEHKPSARILSLIEEYADNVCCLIEPSYSYIVNDIESVKGARVAIEDSVVFQSGVLAQLLGQCEKVAVFVLTIGNRLEEMVCQLTEDKLIVQAAVLDAIGSGVAETVADFVQDRITEEASANGLCVSRRFSPGYCDWDINQQRMVFQAMNGNSVDVRLTNRCLMLPQKSISGIIGIGSCDSNAKNYNPCNTCKRQDCPGRRQDLTT